MKIKSQKNLQRIHFGGGRILRSFKVAPLLGFFATFIIFVALSLMLIFYGAVLQKNQTMAKIQQLVLMKI